MRRIVLVNRVDAACLAVLPFVLLSARIGVAAPAASAAPRSDKSAPAPAASAAPAPPGAEGTAAAAPGANPGGAPSTPPTPPTPGGPTPPGDAPEPPPEYYVEPQGPPSEASDAKAEPPPPAPAGSAERVPYEPPPPVMIVEPPPPPTPQRDVPKTAFWAGIRAGWLVPFGNLWVDGYEYAGGLYYRRRAFSDYASSGPLMELDVGLRLSRRYNLFALWEHASLGAGDLDPDTFGGQERGATNLYGLGVRFSTDPHGLGFLLEVALGYRDFRAYWADGTELDLTGGWLDGRIGLGADIRLARWLNLSPMLTIGGGSFGSVEWKGNGPKDSTVLDDPGQHSFLGLEVGAHVDID